MQAGIEPNWLVFLDEFEATTKMTRTQGRALQGTRLVEQVPQSHWKNNTSVAGLRSTVHSAPLAFDGAMNGDLFVGYAIRIAIQNSAVLNCRMTWVGNIPAKPLVRHTRE